MGALGSEFSSRFFKLCSVVSTDHNKLKWFQSYQWSVFCTLWQVEVAESSDVPAGTAEAGGGYQQPGTAQLWQLGVEAQPFCRSSLVKLQGCKDN